jgi:hypothetical protein
MAFAFNAALIKNEEEPIDNKPKVNKENLSQLLKPVIDKGKDKPSQIDIENIHANLKSENEDELAQFYHKEVTPVALKPSTNYQFIDEKPQYNPLLIKVNHILELLEQQKEIKTNQKNEEIVLYCFLGLFIIYIIDSFVSIGKYSR